MEDIKAVITTLSFVFTQGTYDFIFWGYIGGDSEEWKWAKFYRVCKETMDFPVTILIMIINTTTHHFPPLRIIETGPSECRTHSTAHTGT